MFVYGMSLQLIWTSVHVPAGIRSSMRVPQPLYRLANNGLFSYRLANDSKSFIEYRISLCYRINIKYCFLCEYTSMLSGTGPFLSGKWKPEIRSNTRKGKLGKTRLMCSMIECQHGRRRVQNSPKVVTWLKIALKSLSIWLVITAPLWLPRC